MANETEIRKIFYTDNDADGYDLCEVETHGTRVIRVIESHPNFQPETESREYGIQYAHACGYRD